jgi:hypothetical protein
MGSTPNRTSQPAGGQGPAQLREAERSADNVPAAGMVQPLRRPRPCRPKCRRRGETEAAWLEPGRTRTMTRRMEQLRGAQAMGGRRGTAAPNAPPERAGQGAAGACVSLCRGVVDGAVLVRCSPRSQPPLSLPYVRQCGAGQPPLGVQADRRNAGTGQQLHVPASVSIGLRSSGCWDCQGCVCSLWLGSNLWFDHPNAGLST